MAIECAEVSLTAGGQRRLDAEWLGELVQAEIVAILDRLGPNVWHRSPAEASAVLEELEETAALWRAPSR